MASLLAADFYNALSALANGKGLHADFESIRCFSYLYPTPKWNDQLKTIHDLLRICSDYKRIRPCRLLCVMTLLDFSLEIMNIYRGEDNVFESPHSSRLGQVLFCKIPDLQTQSKEMQDLAPTETYLVRQIQDKLQKVLDIFQSIHDPMYFQTKTNHMTQTILQELVERTWHPSRVQWWMPFDEYTEIFGKSAL